MWPRLMGVGYGDNCKEQPFLTKEICGKGYEVIAEPSPKSIDYSF